LAARAARLEASTSDARLQALRMELHPHFLANALNTVSGLVRAGDGPRALDVLSKIGDLLRRAYARTGHTTTVREEFEAVREYLDIEQIRFSDRLSVSMQVDAAVAAANVPTFILQPLVENAVRHGLGTSADGGRIDITAHAGGGGITLSVIDNGKGIADHAPEGIGLSNTRRRLRELYGERGRLAILSPAGGGTVVTVEIPL
jgi:LytS/YehU family sensor histidine kinase